MIWSELLKQLGFLTGIQILLILVVGAFGKKVFEYFFSSLVEIKKAELSQELEAFKQSLEKQSQIQKLELDKNFEEYRNSLEQISLQHQIKFSKLHEERAAIIKELYSKLAIMEKSVNCIIKSPSGDLVFTERSEIAAKDANDFLEYYRRNEIVFTNETCTIIDKLNTSFVKAWNGFISYQSKLNSGSINSQGERIKLYSDYSDALKKEFPALKEKLKDDFRKTLGVI